MNKVGVALVLVTSFALAASGAGEIKIGAGAPDFKLNNQDRKEVKLSSFKNKKNVILVFYPVANTAV